MFIEIVATSETRLSLIREAVTLLQEANAFAALLEAGAGRAAIMYPSDHPIERTALKGAWFDGYRECLSDLHNFVQNYGQSGKTIRQEAQFGAPDKLYADGDITDEEYRELTGRNPTNRD